MLQGLRPGHRLTFRFHRKISEMYGLPKEMNLDFLVGQTLTQVCVGLHDLVLNFHGEVSITVMSRICLNDPHRRAVREYKDFRDSVNDLISILNRTIAVAKGSCDGTLDLEFESGEMLSVYDDSKEYESYIIRNSENVIVV